MTELVRVELPLTLRSLGNRREDWHARARRVQREMSTVLGALRVHRAPSPPLTIELVRHGWNRLDADGLVGAAKTLIDGVAAWIGLDDRSADLHWHLAQRTTRKRRTVRRSYGGFPRREADAHVTVVIRPWRASDGEDHLRVLAAPPAEVSP